MLQTYLLSSANAVQLAMVLLMRFGTSPEVLPILFHQGGNSRDIWHIPLGRLGDFGGQKWIYCTRTKHLLLLNGLC